VNQTTEVKKRPLKSFLNTIFLGKQYSKLTGITDQIRYLTINYVFIISSLPLIILGYSILKNEPGRAVIDFAIAFACLFSVLLMRLNVPFDFIPIIPVSIFAAYCVYLLYIGTYTFWVAVWLFTLPPIAIFMCKFTVGLIQSLVALAGIIALFYTPFAQIPALPEIRLRFLLAYLLILGLTIVTERISILKDKKEKLLNAQLAQERDVVQTMKDNIQQGIFLMDTELRILPQYSKTLISILSYYDSELAGKNFLDILSATLDTKQLKTMKGYFSMIFSKAKSVKILESANPISELEYKTDGGIKNLSTRFRLIEQENTDPVIIGIIQDITREKEFEMELQAQKDAQEREMKDIFDVIQIDPIVFKDFIDDTDASFNAINETLQDKTLSEKQVVVKFFQNIHAIKSNALVLGLESFGNNLHAFEDEIKRVSSCEKIEMEEILNLTMKLEAIMQELDSYVKITKKIEALKSSNQTNSVLINSLEKAVKKIAAETQKKVELIPGEIDINILESKLRKPIKDILLQCIRNSVYHGIEPVEERIMKKKNPTGILAFSVKNTAGKAELVFSDDGRGLDWKKIQAKYLELNPKAGEVNKKVLVSSIFSPEFSTSDETTSLAGRGVGLSLVKDLVKQNNGSIKVDSSEAGLTFRFIFPLAG